MPTNLKNSGVVGWVYSQFYKDCSLIWADALPEDLKTIPGNAPYAYVINQQQLIFVEREKSLYTTINKPPSEIAALHATLKVTLPHVGIHVIDETLSSEKLRAIIKLANIAPPISFRPLLHSIFMFALFGFVPGAWVVGLPLLVVYGLYKQKSIAAQFNKFITSTKGFFDNFSQTLGERVGEIVSLHPVSIIKGVGTLAFLMTAGITPWSLVGVYGIYRHSNQHWIQMCQKWLESFYNFSLGFMSKTVGSTTLYKRLGIGIAFSCLLALQAYSGGGLSLLLYSMSLFHWIINLIGFNALSNDILFFLKNPIKVLFNNSGKLFGSLWGQWLAYKIFAGHVEGTLGPAIGHVESNGLLSGLVSTFLAPHGWFTDQSGIGGIILSKVRGFFNTIITSVFITTEMHLQGDFYGTVGPSPLQIVAFMALGCLIGYGIERFVNSLSKSAEKDAYDLSKITVSGAKNFYNNAYTLGFVSKWHVPFLSLATPLIMFSPGGVVLTAFAGGSIIGATVLTAVGLEATFATLQALLLGVKYGYKKLFGAPVPQPPLVIAQVPAPAAPAPLVVQPQPAPIVPGFQSQALNIGQLRAKMAAAPSPDPQAPAEITTTVKLGCEATR